MTKPINVVTHTQLLFKTIANDILDASLVLISVIFDQKWDMIARVKIIKLFIQKY